MIENAILNCPKCGAETTPMSFSEIVVDFCQNYNGLFVDYKFLKNRSLKNFGPSSESKRKDFETLDTLPIRCPKCHTEMKKKTSTKGRGLLLDICPTCNSVWFDEGELERFFSKDAIISRRRSIQYRLVCTECKISPVYGKNIARNNRSLLICPRCSNLLSFEAIGEVLTPKIPKRDIVAAIFFVTGLTIFYVISIQALGSRFQAIFFTGTVGMASMFLIVRLLIYNKFAVRFAGFNTWSKVRDFDLE